VHVAVNYAGSEGRAEEVVQELKELGVEAFKVQANIADEGSVKAMVKEVTDIFGRLDILVNNAGITRDNLLMSMRVTEFNEEIEMNLTGAFLCTQAVTRQMMRQRAGR